MRFSRLLSILALLAVLLAPAGMLGSHAAMAMPTPTGVAGPCSEQEQQNQNSGQEQAMIDCAIACTALPSYQPMPAETGLAPLVPEAAMILFLDGTRPEAATPPPRIS